MGEGEFKAALLRLKQCRQEMAGLVRLWHDVSGRSDVLVYDLDDAFRNLHEEMWHFASCLLGVRRKGKAEKEQAYAD
jgi:hypothetical protein